MSISHHSFCLASVTALSVLQCWCLSSVRSGWLCMPRSHGHHPWQNISSEMSAFDRLEYSLPNKGEDSLVWDFPAWYGGDYPSCIVEGENTQGDGEDAEFASLELLYSRLIADFWEFQIGGGYQGGVLSDDHDESVYGVFGLQGTAPYRINGCSSPISRGEHRHCR